MENYWHQHRNQEETNELVDDSYEFNEKITKLYHDHRDMNCIEGSYIEKIMKE